MKWARIFNEAKQVGTIYHFTRIANLKSILDKGLKGNKHWTTKLDIQIPKGYEYSYSFTRNKNRFILNSNTQIVLDGTKMSNKYYFSPVAEKPFVKSGRNSEFEERILSNKEYIDIKPFIEEINFKINWMSSDLEPSLIKFDNLTLMYLKDSYGSDYNYLKFLVNKFKCNLILKKEKVDLSKVDLDQE